MYEFRNTIQGTEMVIRLEQMAITTEIYGGLPPRARRAILLAIFDRINPLLELLREDSTAFMDGSILHHDDRWYEQTRARARGIRLRQRLRTDSPDEKLGFEIRTRRLKSGLSQDTLAKVAGISRTQLSRIEHGQCQARAETLRRLDDAIRESDQCNPNRTIAGATDSRPVLEKFAESIDAETLADFRSKGLDQLFGYDPAVGFTTIFPELAAPPAPSLPKSPPKVR